MTETVSEKSDVEIGLGESVEDHQYVVRLLFKFNAASPAEAVEKMIAELADNGLRNWHYRVEDTATDELFFVTGFGEVKTLDELIAREEEDDDEEADDDDSGSADD